MTFNVKDFVLLHNEYVQQGRQHWGIVVSKQLPLGEALRQVLNVLQKYSPKSMKNRLLFFPKVEHSIQGRSFKKRLFSQRLLDVYRFLGLCQKARQPLLRSATVRE